MKILYVTTIGTTMRFFENIIDSLVKDGNQVDLACNYRDSKIPEGYDSIEGKRFLLDCSRSIVDKGNLKAIKEIKNIVSEEQYDIVHCHTPIAATCTRLACRKARKRGSVKVVYTAHGFHFYKGAPWLNWLVFYPVEKITSYMTDALITINQEDYNLAKSKMRAKRIEYIPGVGVDIPKFKDHIVDRVLKRASIEIPSDARMILSVGELNDNKNHSLAIEAISMLDDSNTHYVIAGEGPNKEVLQGKAQELGVQNNVHLLGFRSDVKDLYKCADLLVHPSYREGLPVAVMEALASGLAVVGSEIRGISDLIHNGVNGCLFNPRDVQTLKRAILDSKSVNTADVQLAEEYSTESVVNKIKKLYKELV